jgi:uncharacterized membrane protein
MSQVLLVGESWFHHTIAQKGFDSYTHSGYEEGTGWIVAALAEGGHEVTHLPCHLVGTEWPTDLSHFDLVLLSDVGANTFLLSPTTFVQGERRDNPLSSIASYVHDGGAFGMIGGYLSFAGIDGRARYSSTPIEDVLPVSISPFDDRVELPEGVDPVVEIPFHPVLGGSAVLGPLLGYNRLQAKADAQVVAWCGTDPLLSLWTVGRGRTFAYASDCGPHWASPTYLESPDYGRLWRGIVSWATGRA